MDPSQVTKSGPHHRLTKFGVHHHYGNPGALEEYSLWAYRQGEWELDQECSATGFEVGPPPDRQGQYEGEVVKTRGIKKQEGI
jgi:hypothetical protein